MAFILLDTKTVTMAPGETPTPSVAIDQVTFWNSQTGAWAAPPVQGILGQQVGVRVVAENFGSAPM
ncbi:MAG: hypothetical protein Q8O76_03740, partial [Chloroflexota bacterium]|nr:hypothetical protein [Chloroflexota bacterium]